MRRSATAKPPPAGMKKRCVACEKEKPWEEFPLQLRRGEHRPRARCKLCKNKGRPTFRERFYRQAIVRDGCWGWRGFKHVGYGRLSEHLPDGQWKIHVASRASWIIHRGPIPDGMDVCHHCDNPECTNPEHLFLGTHQDNMDDMARKGRRVNSPRRGSAHHAAKLTEEQVMEIRAATGVTGTELARRYGVTPTLICSLRKGKGWRHACVVH